MRADNWSSIGKGAALALLEHGAHVTIVSSSQDNIDRVLKEVNHPNFQGKASAHLRSYGP